MRTRTRGWAFTYSPTGWDNYRVGLNVTMQLIDRSGRSGFGRRRLRLSAGVRRQRRGTEPGRPVDRAAGLKAELKKGTDHCLKKLPTETLA